MSKLSANIFFDIYQLLATTYDLQQFTKIGEVKVDYFDFPGKIFANLCELDAMVIAYNF